MAKLNGVTLVSERISYNDAEYVKSEENAVAGDIIRFDEDGYSHVKEGAFYKVDRVDGAGDAHITDEDGDDFDTCGNDFTVFKIEEDASKVDSDTVDKTDDIVVHEGVKYRKIARKASLGEKAILVSRVGQPIHFFLNVPVVVDVNRVYGTGGDIEAEGPCERGDVITQTVSAEDYRVLEPIADAVTPPPTQTTSLPDTYVIHDGKVYVKEARKANVGDTIIVTGNSCNHGYDIGDIKVAEERYGFGGHRQGVDCDKAYNRSQVRDGDYDVLVPTDSVTIEVNGAAVEYTLEKRKAAKGEKVLVIVDFGYGKRGQVSEVTDLYGDGDVKTSVNERMIPTRYLVLVPKAAAQPQYNEVKRKASVGERIRIVNAWVTMGHYKNGDEFTVKQVIDAGGVTVNEVEMAIVTREYVVLEPATSVKQAANPVDSRLKVGEYAKVISGYNGCSNVGDIVIIKEDDKSSAPFNTDHIDGKYGGWFYPKNLTRATDEEVAAAKKAQFSVGDHVRLTSGGEEWPLCGFANGKVYEIATLNPSHSKTGAIKIREIGKDYGGGYANADQLVKVEKAASEPKFSVGDTVKVVIAEGKRPSRGWGEVKNGDVGVINRISGDMITVDFPAQKGWNGNYDEFVKLTEAEVAETERKNVKVGDYVKITQNQANWPAGTIVKVTTTDAFGDGKGTIRATANGDTKLSSKYEPLTPAEAEQLLKEQEEKAQQAVLETKWSAIGRKVNEYKEGDIVRIREDNVCFSKHKKGDVGMVVSLDESFIEVSTPRKSSTGGFVRPESQYVELVTPVESFLDAAK